MSKHRTSTLALRGAALACALFAAGCTSTASGPPTDVVADFEDCRAEVLRLDAAASRDGGNAAQYARAGHMAEQCLVTAEAQLDELGADAMRLHALSVLDLLRGGEIAAARGQLAAFSLRFPNRDLRSADETSVIDALGLVLGTTEHRSHVNVPRPLSAELARIEHWQQN